MAFAADVAKVLFPFNRILIYLPVVRTETMKLSSIAFARALEHFDSRWPEIEAAMREEDLVILTADHGNDPTYPGTDHTREYAPLIVFGKRARRGVNLGTHASLADIGQTIADNFGTNLTAGESFLTQITSR